MWVPGSEIKEALVAAQKQQVQSLLARGVRMVGEATSPVLLIKGELNDAERAGGELLAGADGRALHAALGAVGYNPEDFCALACVLGGASASGADGDAAAINAEQAGAQLSCDLFCEAVETVDPMTVILLDGVAAGCMREAYADALVAIEDFDEAMLKPGLVTHVLGKRVLALDGFEAALSDGAAKQREWAYIKQLKGSL